MKKFILLTVFLFTFFNSYAEDCTCVGSQTFCEAITDINGDLSADFILRGTFMGYDGGIKVQVNHILFGDSIQNDLKINTTMCDLLPVPLIENDEYLFAMEKIDSSFYLIICSVSFLKIEDEVVTGPIAPGIESINYIDLNTLENCGDQFQFSTSIDPSTEEAGLSVFPNPTYDILKIKNTSPSVPIEKVQIEFIDIMGRELPAFKKEDNILGGEIWTINIQHFTSGVYFLKLTANDQEQILKIVKQ